MKDSILLDDDLEIMVIPHSPNERKWLTYDEVDDLREQFSQRIPRMLLVYNNMVSWTRRMERAQRKELGE